MKVAVVGKGGSGKTTTSGLVARELASRGTSVLALDCDTNANLALSLGLGFDVAEELISVRERLDAGETDHADDVGQLVERFGRPGPDGMHFVVVQRIENPTQGCPCCGMSPHQLLGALDAPDRVVIADMEAGIGTLTRMTDGVIDVVVLVVEPTLRSIEVGVRARELAAEKGVERVILIANRVTGQTDLDRITEELPGLEPIVVPDDPVVPRADRLGDSPVDVDGGSPAVSALRGLADQLTAA